MHNENEIEAAKQAVVAGDRTLMDVLKDFKKYF